jgi:hypothetical protein
MAERDLQTFEDNSRKGRIDARHQPIMRSIPKWSFSFSSGAGRSGHAFEHGRPTTPERRPASLVPHDQAGRRLGAGAGSLGAEPRALPEEKTGRHAI